MYTCAFLTLQLREFGREMCLIDMNISELKNKQIKNYIFYRKEIKPVLGLLFSIDIFSEKLSTFCSPWVHFNSYDSHVILIIVTTLFDFISINVVQQIVD